MTPTPPLPCADDDARGPGAAPVVPPGPALAAGERWRRIKAVFDAAIERPEAVHETLIRGAGLDGESQSELRSLLAHHAAASGGPAFLAAAPVHVLAPPPQAATVRPGQRLGAWEVVRAIGSGGMGDVFEARRADGHYEGRAAVKLLKRGMDSAAVLQRFALERRALARLSHPHIARLLDAGASDDGLPYFVMEFVDGQPIDLAVRGMTLHPRLSLFLQLADAVAHAHRNLLVHRDLKPGNVLVDAEGRVKLLDFGIAKALDPLDGAAGGTTLAGQRPYTPHHASPEQVRGEPVGTATDVYSLGVLLYQMLTGARPTGRRAATAHEAARCVLEDIPTRPSRLPPGETTDPHWAGHRRLLEGDLDNILLKALEKAPAQRYSSVEALAADVQACIDGRPVGAHAASPAYVLAKFLRRHRWAVLAGGMGGLGLATGLAAALLQERVAVALGALGLTAGLGVALLKARQAELARARAERHVADLRQLGRDVVLEYGDVITRVPGGMARKAAMLTTTLGYLDRLADASAHDPAFRSELGHLYARLADLRTSGEFNAAEDGAEAERHALLAVGHFAAAEAAHAVDASGYRWWGRALGVLGKAAQRRGALPQALQRLNEADATLQRGLRHHAADAGLRSARADLRMLQVQLHFGWGLPHLGQPEAALAGLDEAQALYTRLTEGPETAAMHDVFQLGTVASSRALVLARLDRWPEAVAAARQAVEQRCRASAMAPHDRVVMGGVAADRNLLGGLHLNLGDAAGALDATQRAWDTLEQLLADDPDNEAWRTQRRFLALNHGRALAGTGAGADALAVLQHSADWLAPLAASGQATPVQCRRLAQTRLAMAQALETLDRSADAVPLAEAALAELQRLVAAEPGDREHARVLAQARAARPAAGPRPLSAGAARA